MNLRSLRKSISGSEHPPLRLLASIAAHLTRSAASKLDSHEGAISVGSIEYEMRGRVVYISGTSGHRVHSRDIASMFSCKYVTKYTRLSRSVCIIESGEPGRSIVASYPGHDHGYEARSIAAFVGELATGVHPSSASKCRVYGYASPPPLLPA